MFVQQLESFVQVAKELNFSKAAETLFVSQSTISARIKNLEVILGVPLFHRSGGKDIRLSEFGEDYLPYAEQCLRILAQGKKLIDDKKSSQVRLRIGVTNPFSSYMFPYVLPAIYQRFPDMDIQIIPALYSEDILQMLNDSQIDMGFINNTEALDELTKDHLNYTTLYESPLILVANPTHPLCNATNITSSAIMEHKFIKLSSKTSIYKLVNRYFETNRVKPLASIEITTVTAAKEIIKMVPLLTMIPKLVVIKEIEDGELIQLNLTPAPPSLITSLVCSHARWNNDLVNLITEKIRETRENNIHLSSAICL